jgi:N-acetylgalactosamine-N,N'-diacetylbacillosaminyl-diphospho-undecaprenol 4-alpha-N-acetylgalactosaminyltransferase
MENLKTNNICILVNSLASGGAEKVVSTLIPHYKKKSINVFLLCLEQNDFFQIEGITQNYLSKQTDKSKNGLMRLLHIVVFAWRLRCFIKKHNIALVQSHMYRSNYTNVVAKIWGSKHNVQIVNHGMPSQYKGQGLLGSVNCLLVRLLYAKAEQIICPSQGMINELIAMAVPSEKLVLIANPVELSQIQKLSEEAINETPFRFNPDKKYVIALGRLEPVKRPTDILKAFVEIAQDNDKVDLIYLGIGSLSKALMELSVEHGIPERIHMLGLVHNPYNFLRLAHVIVSASEFEGFSNVIVESLAVGTPVVATDCVSGPREILAPKTINKQPMQGLQKVAYGVLTPVADISSLANAIELLLNDPELSNHYSIRGKTRSKDFDADLIAEKYFNTIEQLLRK